MRLLSVYYMLHGECYVLDTHNERLRVDRLSETVVLKRVLKLQAPYPWYMGRPIALDIEKVMERMAESAS